MTGGEIAGWIALFGLGAGGMTLKIANAATNLRRAAKAKRDRRLRRIARLEQLVADWDMLVEARAAKLPLIEAGQALRSAVAIVAFQLRVDAAIDLVERDNFRR